mmetsp:Transcript_87196/g.275364  ORF Transcript_87196/g.275364 Transcript_87196/m.275364 type:complete len:416 (-) Transcript_87196:74-1321(-)
MGRKHQRRPRAALAAVARAAVLPVQQAPLALPAPVPEQTSSSQALLPFQGASLALRAAVGLQGRLVRLLDGLRLGVFTLLGSAASTRLACTTRVIQAVVDALAAEYLVTQLRGTCLLQDALAPRKTPLLTLSHLESLADSQLLFGAARELLGLCGSSGLKYGGQQRSAVLLEVAGGEDELCEAVLGLAFPEAAAGGGRLRASALARLATLLFRFRAPGGSWPGQLLQALGERCSTGAGAGEQAVTGGGLLEMYLRGAAEVLPTTRAAVQAAKSVDKAPATAVFLCQLLERLVFPTARTLLALRLSCPVDAGALVPATHVSSEEEAGLGRPSVADTGAGARGECTAGLDRPRASPWSPGVVAASAAAAAAMAQASQTQEFLHTLRELEKEALQTDFDPFDIWALEAGDKHYLLLLE